MVEGGGSDNFSQDQGDALRRSRRAARAARGQHRAVTAYLAAQSAAGAQALMVFDTWGGVLSPRDYREFSLPLPHAHRARTAARRGRERAPLILFAKGVRRTSKTRRQRRGRRRRRLAGRPRERAAAPAAASRCRATSIRRAVRHRRTRSAREVRAALDATAGGARRPCVQPRPRHHAGLDPGTRRPGRRRTRHQRALNPKKKSTRLGHCICRAELLAALDA